MVDKKVNEEKEPIDGDYVFEARHPEELVVVFNDDMKVNNILLDGVEFPFSCDFQMKNKIVQDIYGNRFSVGTDITVTFRPERLLVRELGKTEKEN